MFCINFLYNTIIISTAACENIFFMISHHSRSSRLAPLPYKYDNFTRIFNIAQKSYYTHKSLSRQLNLIYKPKIWKYSIVYEMSLYDEYLFSYSTLDFVECWWREPVAVLLEFLSFFLILYFNGCLAMCVFNR